MKNLFLALWAEHRERTGHDCINDTNGCRMCEVCLHLRAEWFEQHAYQYEKETRRD